MGRNYSKSPHTARWLMTFHTAAGSLPADLDEAPERDAVAFVTGAAPAPEFIFIRGYKIRQGSGLLTEKQAKWVVDIAETKANVTEAMVKSLVERLEQGFAKQAASQFITTYKDWAPKAAEKAEAPAPSKTPEVEDGRYAVEEDGVLKFFKVKNGKRPGFVFLDVQASDDWHSIRSVSRIKKILDLITEDAYGAMVRYGHELGSCGRCGRTLTDEASRAAGIGPICAAK